MSWYRTGTVSITNGATAVTGSGTGWLSQVKAEDRITFNGGAKWYEIASVASNTSITLATAFGETTVSGGAYAIDRSGRGWSLTSDVAASLAAILANYPLPAVGTALNILRVNSAGSSYELIPAAFPLPNLLINGDFQVNQRGHAGGAITNGDFVRDRWKGASSANATFSGYVVTLSAGSLQQVIESTLWGVSSLASTAVTVSVDTPSADLSVTLGSVSGTITAGSGRRSVTITPAVGDTGNLTLSLQKSTAGTVTFGRVKAELGSTSTGWLARPAMTELALCQRYFWRNGKLAFKGLATGFALTSSVVEFLVMFPTEMRATPTLTVGSVGNLLCSTNAYNQSISTIILNGGINHATTDVRMLATLSSAVAAPGDGQRLQCDATSNGYLDFTCEI